MAASNSREEQAKRLENTGSRAQRAAAIKGRVLKAELRRTSEASRSGRRK